MTAFAINEADRTIDRWRKNFWGLYIVGSRASGQERANSDLDLLSVGTFYRQQGFKGTDGELDTFEGFELEMPEELPTEYNLGYVDRKYLIRATHNTEGPVPVDLNVVDLTFSEETLDNFKNKMDVANDGSQLPRIPLFELFVTKEEILRQS